MRLARTASSFLFITTLGALACSTSVQAEIYQWKDSTGKIIYSDTPPPPSVKNSKVITPKEDTPTTSNTEAKPQKSLADKELEFQKRRTEAKEKAAKAEKEKKQADDKKTACESTRRSLRNFESGVRISSTNEKGERYILNDEQRKTQQAQRERFLRENCQ